MMNLIDGNGFQSTMVNQMLVIHSLLEKCGFARKSALETRDFFIEKI